MVLTFQYVNPYDSHGWGTSLIHDPRKRLVRPKSVSNYGLKNIPAHSLWQSRFYSLSIRTNRADGEHREKELSINEMQFSGRHPHVAGRLHLSICSGIVSTDTLDNSGLKLLGKHRRKTANQNF